MAKILLVGTATLDIVYTLKRYPTEDEEMRAEGLRMCRGGNAANTAIVLSGLGHECAFAGMLADAPETSVITADFAQHDVDFSWSPLVAGRPPTSSIYLSGHHRAIVHYRDLRELCFEDFACIDLTAFDWMHFEGRNVAELSRMLRRVKDVCPHVPISLEVEKPRDDIDALLHLPSLLVCSKGYAVARGFDDPQRFLRELALQAPQANLVVGWGEKGAFALGLNGEEHHSPAFLPACNVDTLGAGDTFNAGLINACLKGLNFQQVTESACNIAGRKCGVVGFDLV